MFVITKVPLLNPQLALLGVITALGWGLIATTAVACVVQTPTLPITVYVVVAAGVEITAEPLLVFNPVVGDQV